ncbi:hypothetical protein JW964_27150 [candidate division KSB1 bacterium]|nr:hypothetical protein [candidate division KSB1 bacterium]
MDARQRRSGKTTYSLAYSCHSRMFLAGIYKKNGIPSKIGEDLRDFSRELPDILLNHRIYKENPEGLKISRLLLNGYKKWMSDRNIRA